VIRNVENNNRNVDIKIHEHDAFPEKPSSSTLVPKIF